MRKKRPKPVWDSKLVIWNIPDAAWARIEPVLADWCPPAPRGRPRTVDFRTVLNAVIFRLRTGCQWNHLPAEFGDDSRVHHWFQVWAKKGVFLRIWAVLLEECAELGDINWNWQSADGCMGKARHGGEKNRAKPHRPGQAGHQEEPPGRGRRRTAGGGHRRGQRP
jgi:putative transposase